MRRRRDAYTREAKKSGFPARSVFKLQEIDQRLQLLRKGQRVLDLGCYPGSWLLYACERVGPSGLVTGVDAQALRQALPPNGRFIQGDALGESLREQLQGQSFDVVLSDMAPWTSGHRDLDQTRSFELVMRALAIASELLRPSGSFVAKIFQGPEFEEARAALRRHFDKVRILRPKATRSESYETFLAGQGFRPPAEAPPEPSEAPPESTKS